MRRAWIFCLFLFLSCSLFGQQVGVFNLKCQYRQNPLGVEEPSPAFSWQILSQGRNVKQTAYHILVSDDKQLLEKGTGNIWDSKKRNLDQSIQVIYNGRPLESGKVYYWKVKVWDNQNSFSDWSSIAFWQMGLLQKADWKGAQWIAYEQMPDSLRIVPGVHGNGDPKWGAGKNILPLLRREFEIKKTVKRATAFMAGLGHFDLSVNGKKAGDHFLDAGWTQYSKEALYVTFDITSQLKRGINAIGVMLGNGFYYTPRERYRKITIAYGYPKMICRVLVEYTDGSSENIISDNSWKASPGPITFSSIYGGEDYDANLSQNGWNQPLFNDQRWREAQLVDGPGELNAQMEEPLKILDSFSVKKITQPKPGCWVYDFGQNASGIFSIQVKGAVKQQITFKPAELITDEGLITQDAVGTPVYFNYTLKGSGVEDWQPQFTYYGFRYIQIEGAVPSGAPNPENLPELIDIKSLHTRNAAGRTGNFYCSNELFNRTYTLIDWAIKSNMASVFTDCPHREKLGWLEETHLMGGAIHFNYDIASLCRKVVRDMINARTADGLVPDIAPEYVEFVAGFRDSPEWGSAAVILPWYVYQWYHDDQIIREAYPMMKKYVDYLLKKSDNYILSHGLGDWFDIGPKNPGESQLTPKGITATAIFYYNLTILNKVASLLREDEEAEYYRSLAEKVRAAFNRSFFNEVTQQYGTGSQTANAMAIYMQLVEPRFKNAVIANLVKDIRDRGNSLTAGDIGYHYVLRVLEENGRSDVIFDMNSRSDVPGYGFQLAHGATSLTESWQAYRFVSNNHFMLGHLMEWFYSGLGGIRQAENSVGFKHIYICPEPVGDVRDARVDFSSPYGKIFVEWKKTDEQFQLDVEIPVNTSATIYLPATEGAVITESGIPMDKNKDLKPLGVADNKTRVSVGSGRYHFMISANK